MRLTILFMMIFLLGIFYSVYAHEVAHKTIFSYYNIDSEIKMWNGWDGSPMTIAYEHCPNEACELAQSNVDAFGYQLHPIFFLIGFGILIIIGIIEGTLINENHQTKPDINDEESGTHIKSFERDKTGDSLYGNRIERRY